MNLIGKTREQIDAATKNKSREELVDLIHELATLEPKFTVTEVAKANRMSRDVILAKIKTGEIPREHVHRSLENSYRISLTGIRIWDASTALALEFNGT
jgi:hypothetical protein